MNTNLVIGSEGFIGKPFCKFLEDQGEKVVHFDIKRDPKEDGRFYTFDFTQFDKVYFLAWDVGGSKYLYESKIQKSQLDWNLQLMTNIFHQLEKHHVDFLFVTSQLAEECDTVYGVTKRLGEVWANLLQGVSVRVWNAYGYMEENNIKSHVISDFVYQAVRTGKITMLTNGEERRQFTHIHDLSRAFYMALHSNNASSTTYDASSYEWVKIIDIAHIISELTGAKLFPGKTKGHDPIASPNFGRVHGWLPQVELRDGLATMINEAKELIHGKRT